MYDTKIVGVHRKSSADLARLSPPQFAVADKQVGKQKFCRKTKIVHKTNSLTQSRTINEFSLRMS